MIELQRHIEILLLTNDCVIVPGLGGFMAHHIEARFDGEDNTFVPPLRTLGFNQNLTMNDSLLVQSYIECYDISYPEALRRIEDEVNELRQHLQTEGKYELSDIGVLTLNSEGNIEFRPCEAGILTPGLYGLGTFEMEPLVKAVVAEAEETVTESPTLAASVQPTATDEQQPDSDKAATDEEQKVADEEEEPAIVIKLSWLRNAVAVAAAVLAFFMITTPVSNSKLDPQMGVQQSSIIPLSNQEPETVWEEEEQAETVESKGVAIEGSEKAVTTKAKDAQPSTNVAEVTNTAGDGQERLRSHGADEGVSAPKEYCIVLASQVSQKNADGFVELLGKNGFNEAYITNKQFRRVVYGHYATKDEALSQLRQLRQQSKKLFGEGWVMKN